MKNYSIVLVEPLNPGNIGSTARAMANFGFEKLILVKPRCQINEESRKLAKNAQKILDKTKKKTLKKVFEEHDLIIATTGITCNDYNVIRSPINLKELPIKLKEYKGKVAILFGREDSGLTLEELEKSDFVVNIPSHESYPILNLSHSIAVTLYEIFSNQEKNLKIHPRASTKEKEILLQLVKKELNQMKFSTPQEKRTQELVWKRFIGKALLTKREIYAIMGFFKKIKR